MQSENWSANCNFGPKAALTKKMDPGAHLFMQIHYKISILNCEIFVDCLELPSLLSCTQRCNGIPFLKMHILYMIMSDSTMNANQKH